MVFASSNINFPFLRFQVVETLLIPEWKLSCDAKMLKHISLYKFEEHNYSTTSWSIPHDHYDKFFKTLIGCSGQATII